jgi:hypothetical protein
MSFPLLETKGWIPVQHEYSRAGTFLLMTKPLVVGQSSGGGETMEWPPSGNHACEQWGQWNPMAANENGNF